jgi:ArsR family transcriptional regulator, lead/cadmium/zinc/bismuth-responsive transcriptional repressor
MYEHMSRYSEDYLMDENKCMMLSDLYKVLGDVSRIKILYALGNRELCVGDLAEFLEMSQSAVSHQLRILKQARLVKYTREGKSVIYSLDDHHVRAIFEQGLEHIEER